MIALEVTDLKSFMSALLCGNAFDVFLLEEATITMGVTFSVNGRWKKEFAPCDYEFIPWSEAKSTCFSLIKGKQAPLSMQFVFKLMPVHMQFVLQKENAGEFSDVLSSFLLTVRYDGEKAMLVTGTAYQTFVADKTPDKIWDDACLRYLLKKEIPCEIR